MAFRMISPAFSVTGAFTENRLSSPCRSPFALKITSSPVSATRTTALPFSFVRPIFFAFAIARATISLRASRAGRYGTLSSTFVTRISGFAVSAS